MKMTQENGTAILDRALPTDWLQSMSKIPPRNATRYRTILLFGAPGSGKGTQGKIIGNIPGFYHSATGDIFRSLDLQSEMGRKFWEYAGRGELVPDEFTIKLWRQYLNGMEMINQFHPENQFLVLDGLPRNKKQAELLRDTIDVAAIIYLRAEKAKMVERLRRRALKENRFDDASDEVISKRMDVFERETRPVLDIYPKEIIHRVDATMSQIRVLGEVVKVLVPLKEAMDHDNEVALGHA
ncbi:MAG TPA: nucleoside monophosphate kinase [Tepidisphaeraceae bacterium]|jgi:adenylate kinase|nr:nucleoside monophosphate kinase [Tepidisphaeraceae bacterium]